MKPWENGKLKVTDNKRYFSNGDVPFFWLGDTAWLIFTNITEEEAYLYLKNRADKGFNVIQAVLIYTVEELQDVNKMNVGAFNYREEDYWMHCDRVIRMAEELGMYVALLPTWGSLVKKGVLNEDNVLKYVDFLCSRYKDYPNIIWLLGGDIKAEGYENLYTIMGEALKRQMPNTLIGFHPFGRTTSTDWFADAKWLDFNMFQSGHRRYDQYKIGKWDDSKNKDGFFGPDNWKYVKRDYERSEKPVLDGEPSYEWILQGLHDITQPYWTAKDVRRYAYWSVFQGACGHTYGDNSVMQFYDGFSKGVTYGAKDKWQDALHHEGSGQMGFLKKLMESVDFYNGKERCDLLLSLQGEKYERISVFAGPKFIMVYTFSATEYDLDLSEYVGYNMYFFRPSAGSCSYAGVVDNKTKHIVVPKVYNDDTDWVLVIK